MDRMNPTIAKALVQAQKNLEKFPGKNKRVKVAMKNGRSYSYDYADLAEVIAAIRTASLRAGLFFAQEFSQIKEHMLVVQTTLVHESGESHAFSHECPTIDPGRLNPCQAFGGSTTFARRYALVAIFGIPTVDNDSMFENFEPIEKEKSVAPTEPKAKGPKTRAELRREACETPTKRKRTPRTKPKQPEALADSDSPSNDVVIPSAPFIPDGAEGPFDPDFLSIAHLRLGLIFEDKSILAYKDRLSEPDRYAIRQCHQASLKYVLEYLDKLGYPKPEKPEVIEAWVNVIKDVSEAKGVSLKQLISEVPF